MRQGIGCVLREAEAGSLDEVRRCLEGWRFACRSVGVAEAAATAAGEIEVVELTGTLAPAPGAGRPRLALCGPGDAKALSLAASLGFDDALMAPLDPVELVRRLQALATLAALAAERRRRAELFTPYRGVAQPAVMSATASPDRPGVIVLGKADDSQLQAVAALPPAKLTYLENPRALSGLLRGGAVDLVLVTQPALLVAALAAVEDADEEPPALLAAHAGPPGALELPPQVDLLPLPAPMALARLRLALALRSAELRRWLRKPPLGDAAGLLVDALTGLFNQGAFLDYLRVAGADKALLGLEPDRLDELNRVAGYAAGNRALARLGLGLARSVRAEDLAAHLGGGRFAVAVTVASRDQLERLRRRLEGTIAAGEPWQLLTAAESLPARGAPAQRLARLFADLRRLQPAA
jgi:GGDEF domain-containing protein